MSTLPTFDTPELRDLETLIRERRTVGMYLPTPVPDTLIKRAIDISVWAPNHHVTEPWRFYLMGDTTRAAAAELVRDIVTERRGPEAGEFKAKAWSKIPGMLTVTCQRSPDSELREREDYAACSAMLQNFALYLWRAGLGTKWTTGPITRDARFFEMIGANETEESVVGLIFYGYPKITPEQQRAPLADLLVELP
ncbi:MAG: nitroreductase [Pseudomonadota bacterium]